MSKIKKLFSKAKEVELPAQVVEALKLRTVAEIQQEYTNVCAKIGNIDYSIFIQEQEKKLLCERARELNHEGAKAKQEEALAAKAAEVKKEGENV